MPSTDVVPELPPRNLGNLKLEQVLEPTSLTVKILKDQLWNKLHKQQNEGMEFSIMR